MSISPFSAALNQLCDEKGLPKDTVISALEAALAAAYRKDYGNSKMIVKAKMEEEDLNKVKMFQVFKVVVDEEFKDENNQMILKDAKKIKKNAKIDDEIEIPLEDHADFGRIAAQTAKQVIIQRLQEAERKILYTEFKDKEHKLLNGTVQQMEGNNIIINLGKINAIMLPSEQVPREKYYLGQRLKVYVQGVEETNKGPRVVVSRANPDLIKELFSMEVPEINSGTVTIEGLAREAGSRTKMSVSAHQEGLDPIGSCVGQRGIRVQAVLAEIGEEKIDIVLFDKETEKYIANALSPAKICNIKLNKKNNQAVVYVSEDQLSLAIGKGGQNVRLASKLTGWSIDIEKAEIKSTDEVPSNDQPDDKVPTSRQNVRSKESRSKPTRNRPFDQSIGKSIEKEKSLKKSSLKSKVSAKDRPASGSKIQKI